MDNFSDSSSDFSSSPFDTFSILRQPNDNKKGNFSIAELVVVVIILSIFIVLFIPLINSQRNHAREKNARANVSQIYQAASILANKEKPVTAAAIESILESKSYGLEDIKLFERVEQLPNNDRSYVIKGILEKNTQICTKIRNKKVICKNF